MRPSSPLRALLITFAVVALVAVAVVIAFLAYSSSEFSQCFADFDSRESADRAAAAAEDAGFNADVEPSGPEERHRESAGGRRIAITFEDGETGEDASEFRAFYRRILEHETGRPGHPGPGCLERGPFN